jgi:hypothetical protein
MLIHSAFDKTSGWICGSNEEHILWLPQQYRVIGLVWHPAHIHVLGVPKIQIHWKDYIHGAQWISCFIQSNM